jgi:hypothetical protein
VRGVAHLFNKSPCARSVIATIVMFPPTATVVADVFFNSEISLADKGIAAPSDELKHAMFWRTGFSSLNLTARCARFHIHPNKFHEEILACISDLQQFEMQAWRFMWLSRYLRT